MRALILALSLAFASPMLPASAQDMGEPVSLQALLAALFRAAPVAEVEMDSFFSEMLETQGMRVDLASVLATGLAVNGQEAEEFDIETKISYLHACEAHATNAALWSCRLTLLDETLEDGETWESAMVFSFDLNRDTRDVAGPVKLDLAG